MNLDFIFLIKFNSKTLLLTIILIANTYYLEHHNCKNILENLGLFNSKMKVSLKRSVKLSSATTFIFLVTQMNKNKNIK
jgi:hypothetical protein